MHRGERRRRRRRPRVVDRAVAVCAVVVAVVFALATRQVDASWSFGRTLDKGIEDASAPTRGTIAEDGTTVGSRGGTELMSESLRARLPGVLGKKFYIIKSRVRRVSSDANTLNALWLHDLPGDPEARHLAKKSSRKRFDSIIFVSEWQKRAFEEKFGSFGDKAVVLRNAVEPFETRREARNENDDGTLRLIYHTTPHRGLVILMNVFPKLYDAYGGKLHLDVYSSFSIYGWDKADASYETLFDMCRAHPGCTYHGAVSNDEVRAALSKAHIFAYPSIWVETSCIAAIEALSAGTRVVTSNLGALPETLNGFGTMYEFTADVKAHAEAFEKAMRTTIDTYWDEDQMASRRAQQIYAAEVFGWGTAGFSGRVDDWIRHLGKRHHHFQGEIERSNFDSLDDFADALTIAGRVKESEGNAEQAARLYADALKAKPSSSFAMLSLGILELMAGQSMGRVDISDRGANMLGVFLEHSTTLSPPVSPHSIGFYGAAVRVAYYRYFYYRHAEARKYFDLASDSRAARDDCWDVFGDTILTMLPKDRDEEVRLVARFNEKVDALLDEPQLVCPHLASLSSVFPIAYYYDGSDYKNEIEKWVRLKAKVESKVALHSPHLSLESEPRSNDDVGSKPLRLGVVSSFFTSESSIWGNFGPTMRGLQQDSRFEVSFIYYRTVPITEEDKSLSLNKETNVYLKPMGRDGGGIRDNQAAIASKMFDVLLYLDLHMTAELHNLAMSKLAPIQMVTHGHPVTSGIPSDIMDFFVSWNLAELPKVREAQKFYTEELLLVQSDDAPWEEFTPRTKDGVSMIKGAVPFTHFTRENLDFIPEREREKLTAAPNATWYFCSQAYFKYHHTFDAILAQIQASDPKAILILMKLVDTMEHLHDVIVSRLEHHGVDLRRVVFVPRMKHFELMGMYNVADVVLDSVYFGGDTTTREAFEVGAPVVTLPGKTIGQRWTQAYYRVMKIKDFIAKNPSDYVKIAVRTANASPGAKTKTRERIAAAAQTRLYGRQSAAKLWGDAILKAAKKPTRWRYAAMDTKRATKDEL